MQAFSESVWRNPVNGFGTGCTNWTPRISGCGFTPGPDMLFRLGGTSEEIPEPRHTLSVYVNTRTAGDLYSFGHQLGREATKGVVILDYGKPRQDKGIQGTNLFGGWGFLPIFDDGVGAPVSVLSFTRSFIRGWEDGYWGSGGFDLDPQAHLAIVVGTSNCGALPSVESTSLRNPCVPTYPDETNLTPEHAQAWAQMVSELLEYVIRLGYSSEISIHAGSDMQLAWNRPDATLAWLDAYIAHFDGGDSPSIVLFDFGSCEGCSYIDRDGQVCATESCLNPGFETTLRDQNGERGESWTWNLGEVLYKAAGSGLTLPIPEIYSTDGTHARQWYGLSRYSLDTHSGLVAIPFLSVLTQCKSETEACSSRSDGNTPSEGWHQMLEWLSKHPSTRALSLPGLTTMEYLRDRDVCFDC